MKVEDINWDKYDEKSLDFILKESESFLQETFKSFREVTGRCYSAFGIYSAILSYCASQIVAKGYCKLFHIDILFIGMVVSISFILQNLLPGKMIFPGTLPKMLLIPYFEDTSKDKQLFEYKIQTIVASNNGIEKNGDLIKDRNKAFKKSIYISISSFIACIIIFVSCS